jgi:hypothetical protein|nr:MAG TPA_asm: hypothetical protein [Bacteriophage sp.]
MPKDMTKSAIERQMLDAYFHFRSNLPKKDEESGLDYKKSFKTTEDIASDLSTMAAIDPETIVSYLMNGDYQLATLPDGSIAWAIWERVLPIK